MDDAPLGWHDTGIFDAVSDTGNLQATSYRIFAVNPRATTKLPYVEAPEGEEDGEEQGSPYRRAFPTYDFTHSLDQA